jgi:hypothetical protein
VTIAHQSAWHGHAKRDDRRTGRRNQAYFLLSGNNAETQEDQA